MKGDNGMTTHHMFPKSRFPEYQNEPWNLKRCTRLEHEAWNRLFGSDATPHEAIVTILEEWCPQEMRSNILEWVIKRERG